MINRNIIKVEEGEFRKRCSIAQDESVSLKRLLRQLNVLTIYKPLNEHFSGMCLKSGDNRFILINSNHPKSRQHFTIAHELYHLFIQPGDIKPHICDPGNNRHKQEQEADYFASIFLMPELCVLNMIPKDELQNKAITISTVIRLENYFAVSRIALLIRLKELKLLDESKFEKLRNIPVKRSALEHGYNLALYEAANAGEVIGDYGVKAKKLFDEDKISEGHYLELLRKIDIDPQIEIE